MISAAVCLRPASLSDSTSQLLIAALDAELSQLYAEPGANHFALAPEEVTGDRGIFLLAEHDAVPVGCGALRVIGPETGELKRMYVIPPARGLGVGRKLLEQLESEARRRGLRQLVLETGIRQTAALNLYHAAGFEPIPLYGEYCLSPDTSICLGKTLSGETGRGGV